MSGGIFPGGNVLHSDLGVCAVGGLVTILETVRLLLNTDMNDMILVNVLSMSLSDVTRDVVN